MSILRLSTLSLTLAIAVITLGYANPSFADKPGTGGCVVTAHEHCHDDGGEDPSPIEACDVHPCIASVGKWHGIPASDYAENNGGTYTELSSNDFAKILAALPEGNFQELCDAQDVLIFEWNSPNIEGLDWDSLIDYMACGGDVIWEDTNNIVKLTAGVATDDIRVHFRSTPSPFTITFDSACLIAVPILCALVPGGDPFTVKNSHIEFSPEDQQPATELKQFLSQLPDLEVLGLYGVFGAGGCIVMTGPDNNFHGRFDDKNDERENQYQLLFHELDWVLGSNECTPP